MKTLFYVLQVDNDDSSYKPYLTGYSSKAEAKVFVNHCKVWDKIYKESNSYYYVQININSKN